MSILDEEPRGSCWSSAMQCLSHAMPEPGEPWAGEGQPCLWLTGRSRGRKMTLFHLGWHAGSATRLFVLAVWPPASWCQARLPDISTVSSNISSLTCLPGCKAIKHTQGPYILDISFFVRFHCVMAMTTALGTGGLRFKSNSCCGVSAACYSFHSQRNDSFSKCVYNKCFQWTHNIYFKRSVASHTGRKYQIFNHGAIICF